MAEGTVSPASVGFNSTNYNQPQTITLHGVDDNFVDGDQPYQVTGVSSSPTPCSMV